MNEPLPQDLARIGAELERAIAESQRRGRRRRAVARAAAVLSIAVPLAVGASAGPLAPADGPVTVANPMHGLADVRPATAAVLVSHIPDEPLPDPRAVACLDARDCPSPAEPSLVLALAGRI
jgi:hypothetical protein